MLSVTNKRGSATTPVEPKFLIASGSAEQVGGANVTGDILLSISSSENMAVAYLH